MSDSLQELRDSYKKNGDLSGKFDRVFEQIASQLCRIEFNESFVDVGVKKRIVDFNLYFDDDVYLSVSRCIDDETDDVMYSIARKNRTLSIGILPLNELVDKMREVMKELEQL